MSVKPYLLSLISEGNGQQVLDEYRKSPRLSARQSMLPPKAHLPVHRRQKIAWDFQERKEESRPQQCLPTAEEKCLEKCIFGPTLMLYL